MRKIIWMGLVGILLFPAASLAKQEYLPEEMEKDLQEMQNIYHFEVAIIGRTENGQDIKAAKLGKGKKSILLVGAHHGREWLSSIILMNMMGEYAEAYQTGKPIGGFSSGLLNEVSIWFIPMLNPDGVNIQQGEFSHMNFFEKASVFRMNRYSTDWSRWKANAKGIDLNRQYPAGWEDVMSDAKKPAYKFYKGEKPLQAAEVLALSAFTKKVDPVIAVSYHTSGREIFWHYKNEPENMARDYGIAKKTADMTGYELTFPEKEAIGSGFTDWFITEFKRPGMTIELSFLVDETSPPMTVYPEEWRRNRLVGIMLVKEANRLYNK
jgi:g-D-glutamyl-meso-diaminopimelate peptidase